MTTFGKCLKESKISVRSLGLSALKLDLTELTMPQEHIVTAQQPSKERLKKKQKYIGMRLHLQIEINCPNIEQHMLYMSYQMLPKLFQKSCHSCFLFSSPPSNGEADPFGASWINATFSNKCPQSLNLCGHRCNCI